MSKLRIFLLSLMVVGVTVQLDAARKKQNKLNVKFSEKKEKIEKISGEAQKLFKALPPEIYAHVISFIKDEFQKFSRINKEFRNLILQNDNDGKSKFKDEFLRALLFGQYNREDFNKLSVEKKEKIFWNFIKKRKNLLALKNFKALFGKDLDVNKILDEKTLKTLLHVAVEQGDIKVIDWLLKHDADTSTKAFCRKMKPYHLGRSYKPIHLAVMNPHACAA